MRAAGRLPLLACACVALVPGALAAALGGPAALAPAPPGELERLLALLSQRRHGEAEFHERKYLAALKQPLESSGTLIYEAPDRLEERTTQPHPAAAVLDHGELTLTHGTHQRTLRLADYPQIAPLLDGMRATLAGDRVALERDFGVRLDGGVEHWQLTLVPRDPRLAALLTRVEIEGGGDAIHEIRVQQHDGDHSVMSITPLT